MVKVEVFRQRIPDSELFCSLLCFHSLTRHPSFGKRISVRIPSSLGHCPLISRPKQTSSGSLSLIEASTSAISSIARFLCAASRLCSTGSEWCGDGVLVYPQQALCLAQLCWGSEGGLFCNQDLGFLRHLQDTVTSGALFHSRAFKPIKISWAGKGRSDEKPISCILNFPEND